MDSRPHRYLDGAAKDAFEVWMYPPGRPDSKVKVYTYPGDNKTSKHWYRTSFFVEASGMRTFKFVSTEPPWEDWDAYGQVFLDSLLIGKLGPSRTRGTTWGSITALYR